MRSLIFLFFALLVLGIIVFILHISFKINGKKYGPLIDLMSSEEKKEKKPKNKKPFL
jgi:hypothetical protein